MAMQVVCISTKWGGLGRCRVGGVFLFSFLFSSFLSFFSFPDSAWKKNRENVWKLQLMAVNQILSNIYGILMLWRKQSGTFSLSFKVKFLGSWINFFFPLFKLFFLGPAPPAHVIPEESCKLSGTDCPKFLYFFGFASPSSFPRKTWKSYCASVKSPKEIPACSEGNWHPDLQEYSHCFEWQEKVGGAGLQLCPVCSTSIATQGRACCAVVTFYGTILESRNVNHWIWSPCEWSPFLNQTRDFFFFFVCSAETASTVLLNNTIKPVWVWFCFVFFFAKTEIPVALESWALQI